jgi:hypothetical protein
MGTCLHFVAFLQDRKITSKRQPKKIVSEYDKFRVLQKINIGKINGAEAGI